MGDSILSLTGTLPSLKHASSSSIWCSPPLKMRSVDRVFKFIDLPSEDSHQDLVIDNPHADGLWPSRGHMEVQGLTAKYTETGRAVLSNVSFSVDGGQSVSLGGLDHSSKAPWDTTAFIYFP